jgi:hypothetical protein
MLRHARRRIRRTLRALRIIAARLDLQHFPGSCCG